MTEKSHSEIIKFLNFTENYGDYDDLDLSIQAKNLLSMFHNIEKKLSILPVILMIAGTLGNMIAFYVLTRKKLRNQSTMLYFASLTVVDTISLYQCNFKCSKQIFKFFNSKLSIHLKGQYLNCLFRNFNFFYKYRLNSQYQNLEDQSLFLCRYISFMAHFSLQTSAWILTIISIDRYFLITNNYWKQKFSRNIKFSLVVILSLVITIGLINLPVVFYNGKIQNKSFKDLSFTNEIEFLLSQRNREKKVECYTTKFIIFWQKVAFVLECVFPLILMILFNFLLIKQTQKSSKRLNKTDKCAKFKVDIKKSLSVGGSLNPKEFRSSENSQYDFTSSNELKIPKKDGPSLPVSVPEVARSRYLRPFRRGSNRLGKKFKSDETSLNKKDFRTEKKITFEPKCKNLSLSNLAFLNQSKPKEIRKNNSFLTASNALVDKSSIFLNTSISNTSISNRRNDSGETTRSLLLVSDSYRSSRKYYLNYRNRRIVLMLSLLTLSFTISTLPSSIFYTFFRPLINNKPYKRLLTLSFNVLRHLSHTFNFVIYFTSSSVIKQQLKEIFTNKNFGKWSIDCCLNSILGSCTKIKAKNSISSSRNDADVGSKKNVKEGEQSRDEEIRMKIFTVTPSSLPSNEASSSFFQNQNDIEFIDSSICEESLFRNSFINKNERKNSKNDLIKTDNKPSNINVPKLMLNSHFFKVVQPDLDAVNLNFEKYRIPLFSDACFNTMNATG
ncbi:growth hormone secretagogue receptor type 1-like [Brachionus plicatilis]|uniref:Growth hormone secretagogue receptor type 1-like n=1 Tax=Brachionus plicatilis TaxID=10195 RepID=A0A3M7QLK4_BRAPC|nr:growth hormone secretagogue receptor type 1-like [Brachionus plicatilis]